MKKSLAVIFFITALFLLPVSASAQDSSEISNKASAWKSLGEQIDNSFFFVIDKVVDLQGYFIWCSKGIGRVVFLIAILSAALNYALTGTGLKENLIKIFKATVFFMIVISVYPRIVGWITEQTYNMAYGSAGKYVDDYFNNTYIYLKNVEYHHGVPVNNTDGSIDSPIGSPTAGKFDPETNTIIYPPKEEEGFKTTFQRTKRDNENLFSDLAVQRKHPRIGEYTVVAPANVLKILFLMAGDFTNFADNEDFDLIPDFSRILKGLICAGFTIATGCFALLEYIVCFLEFMLVTSVGVILFPLSIWEGSKFMSEKFIGAVVGFFIKMLFCNIAIFLLLYGFISLFYNYTYSGGFQGKIDQILFIIFSCLLFFYICKSAPGIAQSLLTGTPSLSATGAISAVAGAVGGAMAATKLAGKAAGKVGSTVVGGGAKGMLGFAGSMQEAESAKTSAMQEVADAGGTKEQMKQAGNKAYRSSLASDVGDSFKAGAYGLARNLLGGGNGGSSGSSSGEGHPYSWTQDFRNSNDGFGKHFEARRDEGNRRGKKSANEYIKKNNL